MSFDSASRVSSHFDASKRARRPSMLVIMTTYFGEYCLRHGCNHEALIFLSREAEALSPGIDIGLPPIRLARCAYRWLTSPREHRRNAISAAADVTDRRLAAARNIETTRPSSACRHRLGTCVTRRHQLHSPGKAAHRCLPRTYEPRSRAGGISIISALMLTLRSAMKHISDECRRYRH